MKPIVEKTKNGKSLIIYKNYKFRESHILKNGDISWRCLGRICKASLKTDSEVTSILSGNYTHEGTHPVTMATLARTPVLRPKHPSTSARTPAADDVPPSLVRSTVAADGDSTRAAATPAPSTSTPKPPNTLQTPSEGLMNIFTPSPAPERPVENVSPCSSNHLLAENISLKKEVADLKRRLEVILDHTIESDRRLLQYTDNLFVVSSHTPAEAEVAPTLDRQTQTEIPLTTYSTVAIMTDDLDGTPTSELTTAKNTIERLEKETMALRKHCGRCTILQEEASNMIATIRTLEGELRSAREDTGNKETCYKQQRPSVPLRNRFSVLEKTRNEDKENEFTLVGKKGRKQSKTHKVKTTQTASRERRSEGNNNPLDKTPCMSITISGDSHVRHIAHLVGELHPHIRVSGVCKPGAGLLSIASPSTSAPPASTDHCHVLVAGTNDVSSGREDIIYEHLENIIVRLSAASKLMVATLPRRHDLAADGPVNRNIELLNHYIAELCSRYEGVDLLDLGGIRRSAFTSHGMHLNLRGKRTLARRISERMASAFLPSASCRRGVRERFAAEPTLVTPTATPPEPPRLSGVLQRDSYAGVVKNSIIKNLQNEQTSKNNNFLNSGFFLGTPLLAKGPN